MYAQRGYLQGALGSAQSLGSAAAIAAFLAPEKMDILQLGFTVSTAVVSSGAAVITFYNRSAQGVTSGQVALGTISVPAATAAGITLFKAIEAQVQEGHMVEAVVTTATAGGGAAGAGYCTLKVSFSSENPLNVTNLLASA